MFNEFREFSNPLVVNVFESVFDIIVFFDGSIKDG